MGGPLGSFPAHPDVATDKIPPELKKIDRWVMWRLETRKVKGGIKPTKPPYTIEGAPASHSDRKTWSRFDECEAALASGRFHGIGLVMSEEDDIVGWDLDNVIDERTGELPDWAEELVEKLNSYTEVSPSARGLRILVRGSIPRQGTNENMPGGAKLECYSNQRYVTITGAVFRGLGDIRYADVEGVWNRFFGKQTKEIRRLLKDEKIRRLFDGEWDSITTASGEPLYNHDHSAADLALCKYLVERFDGDAKKVDEVFRASKLFRRKWDEVHFGDGQTYGQHTVAKALEGFTRRYSMTDTGNAMRFVAMHGHEVRYCAGDWYVWDQRRLRRDELGRSSLMAKDVASAIESEADGVADDDYKEALQSFAKKAESKSARENILHLARVEPPIPIEVDDLDDKPDLFNVLNGTIAVSDAGGYSIKSHEFADLITRCAEAAYSPRAPHPQWDKFLRVTFPDQEVLDYVWRAVGYSLTGHVDEQVFFFCYGTGKNGKSQFFDALRRVLGDYFETLPSSALMDSSRGEHPTGLMGLRGARFVLASEVGEGKRFNEELLKQITGESTMMARRMRQDWVKFRSSAKLWIMGNHKPTIRGTDDAIWRRVRMIPFTHVVPPEERVAKMGELLAHREPEGILSWCVRGWQEWRKRGLKPPAAVESAVEQYRAEMDQVGSWVDDNCVMDPTARTSLANLYSSYARAMEEGREYVMSSKAFGQKIRERGVEVVRGTAGQRYCVGIRMKSDAPPGEEQMNL